MPGVTQQDLTSIISMIPQPSTISPSTESTAGTAGSDPLKFVMEGHQHPRLSSASYATTGSGGTVSVVFTRTFAIKPVFLYSVENMDGVTVTPVSYTQDGNGNYNGATIRASKRTAGIALTNAVVALVTVITGATASTSDTPVVGALVSCFFIAQS